MMYGSPASSAAPQPSPTDGNKNLRVPPFPALFFDHQRLFHKYYNVWATELTIWAKSEEKQSALPSESRTIRRVLLFFCANQNHVSCCW